MTGRRAAIVDASALISLAQIDLLALLATVFETVVVPEGVAREVQPSLGALPSWISVAPAPMHWPQCANRLGLGERHVLGMATHRPGATLVLDDRRARRCGAEMGHVIRGSAGLLVDAKRAGAISEVAPLLLRMVSSGAYIGAKTQQRILLEAGESPTTP